MFEITRGIGKMAALVLRYGAGVFVTQGAPTNGTSGTFANLADKSSLLFDQTNAVVYVNSNTKASPTWSQLYPVVEAALAASSGAGLGVFRVAHAIYSFAVDGGALGAITPVSTAVIPANALIVGGTVNVATAVTSAGAATVAVGTTAGSSASALLAATAKASLSIDANLNLVPVFATPVKMSAAGSINITVATAALTAGVIEIFAAYYVAANA